MDVICPACGVELERLPEQIEAQLELVCPACGEPLTIRTAAATRSLVVSRAGAAGGDAGRDAGTLFQPATMVEPELAASGTGPGALGAFLLVRADGAEKRIEIASDRTTFGREGADVRLSDPAVAPRHFCVDVLARDVFLRDLDSGRPTQLNGREVRFVELRPGDEIRVGDTVLVFGTRARNPARGS